MVAFGRAVADQSGFVSMPNGGTGFVVPMHTFYPNTSNMPNPQSGPTQLAPMPSIPPLAVDVRTGETNTLFNLPTRDALPLYLQQTHAIMSVIREALTDETVRLVDYIAARYVLRPGQTLVDEAEIIVEPARWRQVASLAGPATFGAGYRHRRRSVTMFNIGLQREHLWMQSGPNALMLNDLLLKQVVIYQVLTLLYKLADTIMRMPLKLNAFYLQTEQPAQRRRLPMYDYVYALSADPMYGIIVIMRELDRYYGAISVPSNVPRWLLTDKGTFPQAMINYRAHAFRTGTAQVFLSPETLQNASSTDRALAYIMDTGDAHLPFINTYAAFELQPMQLMIDDTEHSAITTADDGLSTRDLLTFTGHMSVGQLFTWPQAEAFWDSKDAAHGPASWSIGVFSRKQERDVRHSFTRVAAHLKTMLHGESDAYRKALKTFVEDLKNTQMDDLVALYNAYAGNVKARRAAARRHAREQAMLAGRDLVSEEAVATAIEAARVAGAQPDVLRAFAEALDAGAARSPVPNADHANLEVNAALSNGLDNNPPDDAAIAEAIGGYLDVLGAELDGRVCAEWGRYIDQVTAGLCLPVIYFALFQPAATHRATTLVSGLSGSDAATRSVIHYAGQFEMATGANARSMVEMDHFRATGELAIVGTGRTVVVLPAALASGNVYGCSEEYLTAEQYKTIASGSAIAAAEVLASGPSLMIVPIPGTVSARLRSLTVPMFIDGKLPPYMGLNPEPSHLVCPFASFIAGLRDAAGAPAGAPLQSIHADDVQTPAGMAAVAYTGRVFVYKNEMSAEGVELQGTGPLRVYGPNTFMLYERAPLGHGGVGAQVQAVMAKAR